VNEPMHTEVFKIMNNHRKLTQSKIIEANVISTLFRLIGQQNSNTTNRKTKIQMKINRPVLPSDVKLCKGKK